ncbi:MAG: nicotinate phosphoribosyltransferase [Paludibacterium sp.]|uniref:nicotinate phosphoribosyltransferase n=1 Tax=Paludibacterium sp. TaxID=1917523 RepID=UPI0025FC2224|nr:nicotinate phosphoribosyltransferase [Paludibacterium sp.]MBV8046245.1 nicotinate phosphoribosyltransferase [Paludibacterium sp.]MBV8649776.1 nicotinate phosphoribosyltransferase [Paludibacterium sp.]
MSSQYVVRSLLENDLYKFTMWQALLHQNPGATAEYAFVCRNQTAFPLSELKNEIDAELDHLCDMLFSQEELDFLSSLRYIKSDFVDFLNVFRFQRRFIKVGVEGETLTITAKGPLVHVMGFEIFVLYIVNELYFRRLSAGREEEILEEGRRRLVRKIAAMRAAPEPVDGISRFAFSDFGLRRRYSGVWHDEVIGTLQRALPDAFPGTSNVYQAMRYNLLPIGTMAHEYMQAHQAFGTRLRDFQTASLESWVHEFRGDLGIALTDVVGMDAFLNDFDLYFAKLFDGLRHDSGDPYVWGEKAIAHYRSLRINPLTKRLVFSDGLTVERALALYEYFAGRIQVGFGIGTHLTNDLGPAPLNIVMKLVNCNDQPVAKLSDSPGKTLCSDETFLAYLRQVFNHPAPPGV